MRIEHDVMVAMRDGVRLATDIYLPDGDGPYPTLLTRTPYNKNGAPGWREPFPVEAAVDASFVVVIQDVRGRFASEGEFLPPFQERNDGADCIAWVASQPWSTGNIGTFGPSYLGAIQWMAAVEQLTALKAIATSVSPGDYYDGCA